MAHLRNKFVGKHQRFEIKGVVNPVHVCVFIILKRASATGQNVDVLLGFVVHCLSYLVSRSIKELKSH